MRTSRPKQAGVTLFELVIALVIISVASAAVLGVYTQTVLGSADPMIRQQAVAIGEAYMDEIMSRPFRGTTGPPDGRDQWDNIDAYDNLNESPPVNVNGNTIAGLGAFTVDVSVTTPNDFVAGDDERLIEVRVFDDRGTVDITLSAYRTDW